MTGSYIKTLFRTIKNSFGRFLSIVIITAIGVAMYSGLYGTAPTMQNSTNSYLQKQNVYDLQLFLPDGIQEKHIQEVKDILDESVTIELAYQTDTYLTFQDEQLVAKALTYNKLNVPYLVEGRLIKNEQECLVQEGHEELINQEIELESPYATRTCTVVGTIKSPTTFGSMYKGSSRLGVGRIDLLMYVSEDLAFPLAIENSDLLELYEQEPIYTQMYIKIDSLSDLNRLHDEYEKKVAKRITLIENHFTEAAIFSLRDNPSVKAFEQDSKKIQEIGAIFPIVFFLVATLVCLTTMTRMIDKDRLQIGTLKALGYGSIAISLYYLIYAFIAVFLGTTFGLLIGFNSIPLAVLSAYQNVYVIPITVTSYDLKISLFSIAIVFSLVLGATLIASIQSVSKQPAVLMRPKSPPAGKRIFLEYIPFLWKHFSFTNKVTARNILRYKKLFFMSVFGIMGCTMLLAAGLGIRSSIDPIRERQFNEIYKYDYTVYTDTILEDDVEPRLDILNNIKGVQSVLNVYQKRVDIKFDTVESAQLFVIDSKQDNWIKLTDTDLTPLNNDVIITYKIAETLGVKVGDTIHISIDNKDLELVVGGIARYYFEHFLFVDEAYFKSLGFDLSVNSFLVKGEPKTINAQTEEIVNIDWVQSVILKEDLNQMIKDSMSGMYAVIGIMVLFAGSLIIVVMYNLNTVNIEERRRELATIKVLGFYDTEVALYVYKENIVLTLFGILVGLISAKPLHTYIATQAEPPTLMFIRYLQGIDYTLAFIITFLFVTIVNLFMYRNLKAIDMIESLKANE